MTERRGRKSCGRPRKQSIDKSVETKYTGHSRQKKRKKEKYNSYKGEIGKVADNLLNRDFSAERAFEKLATDVTQFNVRVQKGNYEKIIASKQLFSMR